MNLDELYSNGDTPNCCKKGNKYVYWYINKGKYGLGFTGWAVRFEIDHCDSLDEQIFHCPFCGYDLGLGKVKRKKND